MGFNFDQLVHSISAVFDLNSALASILVHLGLVNSSFNVLKVSGRANLWRLILHSCYRLELTAVYD